MDIATNSDSRIADANGSWQAACDVNISNWAKTNEFIIAVICKCNVHAGCSATLRLQWRRDSEGVWRDLAASGEELIQGTTTVLTNCTSASGYPSGCQTLEDSHEIEGANQAVMVTTAKNFVELDVAVDPSNALDGETYSFRIYDVTAGAEVETGPWDAQITMATAGAVYNIPLTASANQTSTPVPSQTLNLIETSLTSLSATASILKIAAPILLSLTASNSASSTLTSKTLFPLTESALNQTSASISIRQSLKLSETASTTMATTLLTQSIRPLSLSALAQTSSIPTILQVSMLSLTASVNVSALLSLKTTFALTNIANINAQETLTLNQTLRLALTAQINASAVASIVYVPAVGNVFPIPLSASTTVSSILSLRLIIAQSLTASINASDLATLRQRLTLLLSANVQASESLTTQSLFPIQATATSSLTTTLFRRILVNIPLTAPITASETPSLTTSLPLTLTASINAADTLTSKLIFIQALTASQTSTAQLVQRLLYHTTQTASLTASATATVYLPIVGPTIYALTFLTHARTVSNLGLAYIPRPITIGDLQNQISTLEDTIDDLEAEIDTLEERLRGPPKSKGEYYERHIGLH